jgi:hypothetical protein
LKSNRLENRSDDSLHHCFCIRSGIEKSIDDAGSEKACECAKAALKHAEWRIAQKRAAGRYHLNGPALCAGRDLGKDL